MEYGGRGGRNEKMTEVVGRLKYSRLKAEKLPAVQAAQKADRKAINTEIKAKTDYEQAQKRIVSVSGRFVTSSVALGLPLSVVVNGLKLMDIAPTVESSGQVYGEVKTALMHYLDTNREQDMKISGVLG